MTSIYSYVIQPCRLDLLILTYTFIICNPLTKDIYMEFLDKRINLRVKPSDREILQKKADEKKISLSSYCREELLKTTINNYDLPL